MEKLTGNKKINIAVFISGRGSNLINLIKFSHLKRSKVKINLVISDNLMAKGIGFAKKFKKKFKKINYKSVKKAENNILKLLSQNNIHLVCLAGFMKILSSNFIKKFQGKIINIHPSLLPKYKGLNTHYRAIKKRKIFWMYCSLCQFQIR